MKGTRKRRREKRRRRRIKKRSLIEDKKVREREERSRKKKRKEEIEERTERGDGRNVHIRYGKLTGEVCGWRIKYDMKKSRQERRG